jgi:hypothetical protein
VRAGASPSASASPTESDTASETAAASPADCLGLTASIDVWEGAAGARIATISALNETDASCSLGGPPGASLLDGNGTILAASTGLVGGGPSIDLEAGSFAQVLVSVRNWCGAPPQGPIGVGLTLPDGSQIVAAPGPDAQFEPPPCNAPGQPTTIEVSSQSWTLP